MTVAEYLKATGLSIHALSMGSGISYTTLHPHVRHGRDLSVETAKKLEEFDSRMNAAEILGLKPAGRKAAGR